MKCCYLVNIVVVREISIYKCTKKSSSVKSVRSSNGILKRNIRSSNGILNKNICGLNGILNRNIRSSNGILNRNTCICNSTGILNRNIFYILGPCNIQEDMVVEHFKETSTLLDLRHKMETTHFVILSGVILIFFILVLVTLLDVI